MIPIVFLAGDTLGFNILMKYIYLMYKLWNLGVRKAQLRPPSTSIGVRQKTDLVRHILKKYLAHYFRMVRIIMEEYVSGRFHPAVSNQLLRDPLVTESIRIGCSVNTVM